MERTLSYPVRTLLRLVATFPPGVLLSGLPSLVYVMASEASNRESVSWECAVSHTKPMTDKNTAQGKVPFFADGAPDPPAGQ